MCKGRSGGAVMTVRQTLNVLYGGDSARGVWARSGAAVRNRRRVLGAGAPRSPVDCVARDGPKGRAARFGRCRGRTARSAQPRVCRGCSGRATGEPWGLPWCAFRWFDAGFARRRCTRGARAPSSRWLIFELFNRRARGGRRGANRRRLTVAGLRARDSSADPSSVNQFPITLCRVAVRSVVGRVVEAAPRRRRGSRGWSRSVALTPNRGLPEGRRERAAVGDFSSPSAVCNGRLLVADSLCLRAGEGRSVAAVTWLILPVEYACFKD